MAQSGGLFWEEQFSSLKACNGEWDGGGGHCGVKVGGGA